MVVLYILAAVVGIELVYILFLGVCALLVNPKKEYPKNSPFYRAVLNGATAVVIKMLRIRVHVTGMEKVPEGSRLLFVGDHKSNYDPIVTWYAFKKWKLAFLSKAGNFKIPFFGRIIRKCCFMVIDREDPRKAIVTINKAAQLLKEQEVSIGVYPEGTRSKSGQLLPFHNGVFKIAQKADASMVVVAVTGTEKIHKNIPFRHSDVYWDVLDVIPAEELKGAKTELIGQNVRQLLETNKEKRK